MLSTTQKDIYLMNPITRRSIVIGGRVYKKLVKDGYLDPNTNQFINQQPQSQPQEKVQSVIEDINEEDEEEPEPEPEALEKLIADLNNEGNEEEISKLIAEASKNVMSKYKDKLSHIDDDEDLYNEVRALINTELKVILKI